MFLIHLAKFLPIHTLIQILVLEEDFDCFISDLR